MRAMFMPDSASGMAQPRITSSISSGGDLRIFFEQTADDGAGQIVRTRSCASVPRGALPTGGAETIDNDGFSCHSKRLGYGDAYASQTIERLPHLYLPQRSCPVFSIYCMRSCVLRIAAQAQESLALQIQQVLFGDGLLAGQAASAQNVCQLLADDDIVIADVIAPAAPTRRRASAARDASRRPL